MKAKKSLGQNFLKSPAVVRKMIKVAEVTAVDTVLEIGPGRGALTHYLLETGARVIAIEKDADMIPILEEKFTNEIKNKQLQLIHSDITTLSSTHNTNNSKHPIIKSHVGFDDWVQVCGIGSCSYKVVANIPYNITGEIIRTFLETKSSMTQPISMTLMVQKEVAQRIVARDGKESILSMSVKAYGEPKYVQKVPAMLFNPKPKVDSAILHIANISKDFFKENHITEQSFFKVLKQGFAQKRKKLSNNIKQLIPPTPKPGFGVGVILEQIEINPKARAETLTLQQWGELTKLISNL